MTNPFFLSHSLQLLLVVSGDWNAVDATLYRYQRHLPTLPWELVRPPIPVALGEHGMAWGRGLHKESSLTGPSKMEGDRKSPAGVFSLGPAFGDALHQSCAQRIPFLLITEDLECVDDPASEHYNQFVHAHQVIPDWKSSEKMHEIGPLYGLGLVVHHNTSPIIPGMGSAIFMHIWGQRGAGSAGCTTMEETHLAEVISWLDGAQNPCLVQLPFEEYTARQHPWGLPLLP